MSIWADQQIKEIRADVAKLRKELDELKSAQPIAPYQIKADKVKKPRREADDLI